MARYGSQASKDRMKNMVDQVDANSNGEGSVLKKATPRSAANLKTPKPRGIQTPTRTVVQKDDDITSAVGSKMDYIPKLKGQKITLGGYGKNMHASATYTGLNPDTGGYMFRKEGGSSFEMTAKQASPYLINAAGEKRKSDYEKHQKIGQKGALNLAKLTQGKKEEPMIAKKDVNKK